VRKRRQQVTFDVRAVLLQRALVALARPYLLLEALKPPAHDRPEPQARRNRHIPVPTRLD
jgi:hypothetical protein